MAKLFVFGIGGTGARVVKSLTMLLASGVRSNYNEIIPILIDPDRAGGDLNRTLKILKEYWGIQKELQNFEHNDFFKARILTLSEMISRKGGNTNVIDGFKFELDGVQTDSFKDFLDFGTLDPNNKYLTSLLFSDANLNSDLEKGFKGNPNIGSVVLNQFTKSDVFEAFARNFEEEDRIFIVSSIFGGTGAAGFPLLLKNIREGKVKGEHFDFLKNAIVGAITVMPYFKVAADNVSEIDSKGFISKTKAALHYYFKNVTGNNSVNALYYVGDLVSNEYENNEGGNDQRNDAHFVELISATAILDFANTDSNFLQTLNGRAQNPVYKEFGIREPTERVSFSSLYDETSRLIGVNLTKYFYFDLFLIEKMKNETNHPFASAYSNKFDDNFFDQTFFKTIVEFNKSFRIWLGELHRNKVGFSPFNIAPITNNQNEIVDIKTDAKSIFSLVNGVKEKKNWNPLVLNNYELYISELNKAAEKVGNTSTSKRFMGVFSQALTQILDQKIYS